FRLTSISTLYNAEFFAAFPRSGNGVSGKPCNAPSSVFRNTRGRRPLSLRRSCSTMVVAALPLRNEDSHALGEIQSGEQITQILTQIRTSGLDYEVSEMSCYYLHLNDGIIMNGKDALTCDNFDVAAGFAERLAIVMGHNRSDEEIEGLFV